MDGQERIRRGYHAIGPGASRDVLAMFHQEQDEPPLWVVHDAAPREPGDPGGEVMALSLFGGVPATFELMGVELSSWELHERRERLVVGGRYRMRPHGSWEVVALPFLHIWSLAGDQVEGVFDYLSGVEVRRRGAERMRLWGAEGLLRRLAWWRHHDAA